MKKTLLGLAVIAMTLASGFAQAAAPTQKDLQEIKEFCSRDATMLICYQITSKLEVQFCAVGSTYPASDCNLARYVKTTIEGQISKKTQWAKANGLLSGAQ